MGNLFAALNTVANAFDVFNRSIAVSENNVTNASTPGYAKQSAVVESLPFDLAQGLYGGVRAGDPASSRDQYAERAVWRQVEQLGKYTSESDLMARVQDLFDPSGATGVSGALNQLAQSFSQWSANPSDASARQDVLNKAQDLGLSFQQAAATLSQVSEDANGQIQSTVDQINSFTSQIRDYDQQRLQTGPDAGLDANLHSSLESLAELVNIDVRYEQDGMVTVLAGGQTPLVIGTTQQSISAQVGPTCQILSANGDDITSQISSGNLGGLLATKNQFLASLLGDGSQPGALNQLAQHVADRVNQILTSAVVSTDSSQAGTALFSYDPAAPAGTLAVNPAITPDQLAAANPGPPPVVNGAATQLAGLLSSTDSSDQIGGLSILDYFGSLEQSVGQQISDAQDSETLQNSLVAQARSLRSQISGVSLDQEAVQMVELQRGYQAAAHFVTILDDLTQSIIDMVR